MGRAKLSLAGRVVVVTGGAQGIGLEIARAAARRGGVPVLIDMDGELARARARELGGGALALQADVTELEELEFALAQVVERLGGIDVLVANAGVGPLATTVELGDRAHQRRVLDVNLHGVWHTMWAGSSHVARRRGHIVVISSVAAFVSSPSWAAYGASKAAVEQLARSMRVELAPGGTTVGVAHFGLVDTDLVRTFRRDPVADRLERLGGRRMRAVTPQAAAAALIGDVECRAPRTVFPNRWRLAYYLRGLLGPLADAILVRAPRARAVMRSVRERDVLSVERVSL